MAPRCTLCTHADRETINRALLEGAPIREIVERYDLSNGAVHRHRNNCLAETIAASKKDTAASLLAYLAKLRGRAERLLSRAEKAGDLPNALRAVDTLVRVVSLSLKGVETADLEARLRAIEERELPEQWRRHA